MKSDKNVKEMSRTGGGTAAGATAIAGTGEQYATPKAFKKITKEDIQSTLKNANLDKDILDTILLGIKQGLITPKRALELINTHFTPTQESKDVEPKLAAGKVKDNYAVSHFGFTPAPSKANRLSKAIDYKELWEDSIDEIDVNDPILMKIRAQKDTSRPQTQKPNPNQDKINILLRKRAEIERNMEQEAEPEGGPIADKYGEELNTIDQALRKLRGLSGINENYAQFRNETSKRNAPEQLHKAVKAIKQKILELNKLLEYTHKLKSEVSEGTDGFKYSVHTVRSLEQIQEMVKQVYIKTKKLK